MKRRTLNKQLRAYTKSPDTKMHGLMNDWQTVSLNLDKNYEGDGEVERGYTETILY